MTAAAAAAAPGPGGDGRRGHRTAVTADLYRAMTLHRLGRPVDVRRLAADARSRMKPLPPDGTNPLVVRDLPYGRLDRRSPDERDSLPPLTPAAPPPGRRL